MEMKFLHNFLFVSENYVCAGQNLTCAVFRVAEIETEQ